jgi:hypothetical protein
LVDAAGVPAPALGSRAGVREHGVIPQFVGVDDVLGLSNRVDQAHRQVRKLIKMVDHAQAWHMLEPAVPDPGHLR